jgi:hypothetical protein
MAHDAGRIISNTSGEYGFEHSVLVTARANGACLMFMVIGDYAPFRPAGARK